MNEHVFRAMGTEWCICADRPDLFARAEAVVRDVEARLSRFVPTSAVRCLRDEGTAVDPMLARVVEASLGFTASTGGVFTILLGRELASLGYDRSFDDLEGADLLPVGLVGPSAVRVEGDRVTVDGPAWVDLGGIAKGWTVDHVHDLLRAWGAQAVLVDGGGDVRGSGAAWPIGVTDDRAVVLEGGAVATSSTLKRRWAGPDGPRHHIVDPRTGLSAVGPFVTVTVCAPDATTADVLATTLLVDPRDILPRLEAFGASALLVDADGQCWTTPDWSEAT